MTSKPCLYSTLATHQWIAASTAKTEYKRQHVWPNSGGIGWVAVAECDQLGDWPGSDRIGQATVRQTDRVRVPSSM